MSEKLHLTFGLIVMFGGAALIWWNPSALIIPVVMGILGAVISGITIYRIRKGYGKKSSK